eukprot:CAMPEP_0174754262 /NCGR_PEP_ID=MMETSP1094-20130205/105647_1 /TAXON_ID=156173 /ORGANISM="Chrysochromulina brevifilum, Strain UTEX LB 985" /LENGTH=129 /DNA_ID=CAMNT_0015960125 /DNA_START=260 /DNA_END=651 /DNA_ORIENTATION=+
MWWTCAWRLGTGFVYAWEVGWVAAAAAGKRAEMLTASRRWLQVEGVRTAQAASSDARLRYLFALPSSACLPSAVDDSCLAKRPAVQRLFTTCLFALPSSACLPSAVDDSCLAKRPAVQRLFTHLSRRIQ